MLMPPPPPWDIPVLDAMAALPVAVCVMAAIPDMAADVAETIIVWVKAVRIACKRMPPFAVVRWSQ